MDVGGSRVHRHAQSGTAMADHSTMQWAEASDPQSEKSPVEVKVEEQAWIQSTTNYEVATEHSSRWSTTTMEARVDEEYGAEKCVCAENALDSYADTRIVYSKVG